MKLTVMADSNEFRTNFTSSDDELQYSDPATVNITVLPVDDPPVVYNYTITVIEDSIIVAVFLNVTILDNDNDDFTITILSLPKNGTLYSENS